jgi:hypothetical protein
VGEWVDGRMDLLRWFSRGASVGGAKVKLCIWAVCGSNGRPVVSGMPVVVLGAADQVEYGRV